MQQLQHINFTTLPFGRQIRNEQSLLPPRNSYVQFSTGFAAMGNKNSDDKIRPWFKRQEA